MDILITFFLIILIFGVLVGIHELGHFFAAKKCGVWVQEFAYGFGPTMFSKRYKDTIYKINLIPLGGYVKLFGERRLAKSEKFSKKFKKLDSKKQELLEKIRKESKFKSIKDETDLFEKIDGIKGLSKQEKELLLEYELQQDYRINDNKRYSNKSISQRSLIISAGVIMNIILGILIYAIYMIIVGQRALLFNMADANFIGAQVTSISSPVFVDETKISQPTQSYINSPIVSIEDEYIVDLDKFVEQVFDENKREIQIEYFKNGIFKRGTLDKESLFKEFPEFKRSVQYSGNMVVGKIIEDTAAARAGLQDNIIILELAGNQVEDYDDFLEKLEENQGREVVIKYVDVETLEVKDSYITLGSKQKDELIFGGTQFYEYYPFGYFPGYLLDYSDTWYLSGVLHSYNIVKYQYDVLENIIRYSFETKDTTLLAESVGGPIRIGNEIGNLVKLGNFIDILNLTALISLSLGVMNLLPIPIVDGGHLLFLLIEKIKGSPLSEGIQGFFNLVGLVFIILLSLIVTLKDIWTVILN